MARIGPINTTPKVAIFCARRCRRRRRNFIQCVAFARAVNGYPRQMSWSQRDTLPQLAAFRTDAPDLPLHVAVLHQLPAACHVNIEISNLLTQSIAVDTEKIGAFRLITPGRIQRDLD